MRAEQTVVETVGVLINKNTGIGGRGSTLQ